MIKTVMASLMAFVFAFFITTGFVSAQTVSPTTTPTTSPTTTTTPAPTSTTPGAPSTGFGQ